MKAKPHNIGRVALAIVLIMLLTLLPHHHHEGGAICYVAEVCHEDGRVNDSHTQHNDNKAHCFWHKVNVQKVLAQSDARFLPLNFWHNTSSPIIHSPTLSTAFGQGVSMYVCSYSKHHHRRGPPLIG